MKKIVFLLFSILLLQNLLLADITFPKLTGRVVDNAGILTSNQKETLTNILNAQEKETSNQIIILTLKSLDGNEIADYGYQIGRYWKIGQKEKDNGILLIVSMEEKKIRIEVGYGLEGSLTDARSHKIIEYKIKPYFKKGDYYKGILEGTNAIISSIKGEYKQETHTNNSGNIFPLFLLYFLIIFIAPFIGAIFAKMKLKKTSRVFKAMTFGGFGGLFMTIATGSFIISLIAFIFFTLTIFRVNSKIGNSTNNSNRSSRYNSIGYGTGFGGGFSSGSSSFGGSFGGGGGSFGGGGASGGW
ncbi:MAG: TPM domain-containing protein [Arcobacter sp.]|uniref:TPM domain-containing protein n=1 Tax=Arcobacter sp. TaxID=1872629 RepID=UPI003C770271